MKPVWDTGASLFGDAVIENPRDIFDSALLAPFVKRAACPAAGFRPHRRRRRGGFALRLSRARFWSG